MMHVCANEIAGKAGRYSIKIAVTLEKKNKENYCKFSLLHEDTWTVHYSAYVLSYKRYSRCLGDNDVTLGLIFSFRRVR